ncbi:MAG: hypothetical protein ABJH07_16950 [Sedimentitalea sp.]|uniref:hypothetical protein n=1 Tax=Sedimentitalea sp. TaxID=2048915 RepID=UPI003267256D
MSQTKELQFTPKTYGALVVFGQLINELTTDPISNPNLTPLGGGRYKMSVENFSKAMIKGLKLAATASGGADPDFVIRADVKEIELVERRSDVFEVLLPEPSMMQNSGESLRIPSVYGLVDYASEMPLGENSAAFVDYPVPSADYDVFLHSYMAAYMCSQCA